MSNSETKLRVRYSLQELQSRYDTGDVKPMDDLIKAWIGIQEKDPKDSNSFFCIGGYHGEPFRDREWEGKNSYWGGYCNHGNVLFPTWHRAYILRLEDALRSVEGCEDVTLPFWDECFKVGKNETKIPAVLTTQRYTFSDGKQVNNPLYSYKFQDDVRDAPEEGDRYTKLKGYETVRYPQSGLVGTVTDVRDTNEHNKVYNNGNENTEILNGNVNAWMFGNVKIPTEDDGGALVPDTYSVYSRFRKCLEAPNYTVFSNTTSMTKWIKDHGDDPKKSHYVVSLESPHNAMHLAVGGFYQEGVYNASPIRGANGDMGENNTASLDPIFFFHHCFIDKVFWLWQQRHNLTAAGSLSVIPGYPGTNSSDKGTSPTPNIGPRTSLDMNTPLWPFIKRDQIPYTSYDVTDIKNQLNYTYGVSSLDAHKSGFFSIEEPKKYKSISGIDRTKYPGSFVVRLTAHPEGQPDKKIYVGWEAVLSRWAVEGCANCQNSLDVKAYIPIQSSIENALRARGGDVELKYEGEVQHRFVSGFEGPGYAGVPKPIVGDL